VNSELRAELESSGVDAHDVERIIATALDEDLRFGPDVTSEATIAVDQWSEATIVARQPGVVCGLFVALGVLEETSFPLSGVTLLRHDGDAIVAEQVVMSLSGPLRPLLLAERTMLNFITHLSGVATATNTWVHALEGTHCHVRDTRKTTPGLRQLEKYAVRCGGGVNHRLGLGDAALVKDNHVDAAGGITKAVAAIRSAYPALALEVECDTLEQVREAVSVGCDMILLDNMDLATIEAAVDIIRSTSSIRVEASGSMTIERARQVAQTGVDYIAVGSLTHSVTSLDLGLDIVANIAHSQNLDQGISASPLSHDPKLR
jgi:nicotinate-nucleotide pyrophosphorylase (carboxylating)